MRLVYLDEAGVSNPRHEPFLVVAGAIIHADLQYKAVEKALSLLAQKYLGEEAGWGFVFHAMDVWHGSGAFPRDQWIRSVRLEILKGLVEILKTFNLPIAAGYVRRSGVEDDLKRHNPRVRAASVTAISHALAFVAAAKAIDKWMRLNASDEAAMLFAENTHQNREAIRAFHDGYRHGGGEDVSLSPVFRSQHIIDTVHFVEKNDSALLQLGDVCSFLIKRRLQLKDDEGDLYKAIEPQIILSSGKAALAVRPS